MSTAATSYRVAGRVVSRRPLTGVGTESQFARCVSDLFAKIRPRKVIETGAYHGTGTTTIIAKALRQKRFFGMFYATPPDVSFVSIEVNPEHFRIATENLAKAGLKVEMLNGLSVPRSMLPTARQIEEQYVRNVESDGLFVDFEEQDRVKLYLEATDFPQLPDDLLGKTLQRFSYAPDFVLLDSAGHMGYVEFMYVIERLKAPCYIGLDDTEHVKHFRSLQHIRTDSRFELIVESDEKFGFCIAKFTPTGK
jgi:hypothetical protein